MDKTYPLSKYSSINANFNKYSTRKLRYFLNAEKNIKDLVHKSTRGGIKNKIFKFNYRRKKKRKGVRGREREKIEKNLGFQIKFLLLLLEFPFQK